MNLQHRLRNMNQQKRSYTTGSVELINDQWIFFDDENEEASMFEEFTDQEIEVYLINKWEKGVYTQDGIIMMHDYFHKLEHGTKVRILKNLPFAYTEFLTSLCDDTFTKYTATLNQLSFSLFDCIYCHNYMMYTLPEENQEGVNFITYDNTEIVCSVQHHFSRGNQAKDRFEFTLATGKRALLSII